MTYEMKNTEKKPEVKFDTELETETQPPDGGWGWVVCFATFMTNFVTVGTISTNGIILLGLLDLFNESISKTSLVGSIIAGASLFGGPFVLVLMMCKASHRQIMMVGGIIAALSTVASAFVPRIEIMIFTYGILAGLSLATCVFAANVILGCYFNKKRALAIGIANSGTGFGNFILSYLMERSISFYGIRGTFILIGGLFLNLTVFGSLCRPLKSVIKPCRNISESKRSSEDKTEGVTNPAFTTEDENTGTPIEKGRAPHQYSIEVTKTMPETLKVKRRSVLQAFTCNTTIFRNKTFGLLLVIYSLWAAGDSLLIYLPAYAESVGLSREESTMVLSSFGIVAALSQISVGFLADFIHIPISYLLSMGLFCMSLSILSIPFCQTFETILLSTIGFSIGFGSGISLRIVLLAAVLGPEKISDAYGIMTMLIGVAFIVYPIVSGLVYDATLSFPAIFYVDFAITFLGAILSFGFIYAQRKGYFV